MVGTDIPDGLILVHEFGNHYSWQARKKIIIDDKSCMPAMTPQMFMALWR